MRQNPPQASGAHSQTSRGGAKVVAVERSDLERAAARRHARHSTGIRRPRFNRHRTVTATLAVPVACLLFALLRRAWLDIDTAWDSLAYHMPFAAYRAGIISFSQYRVLPGIEIYYHSFPVLADYFQGWLWKLTSRPAATNLAAYSGLLILIAFLWRAYRLPVTDTAISFLAIPVVLIQSTSSYIDLLTNCAMTVLIVFLFRATLWPNRFKMKHLLGACVAFALAANCKSPFIPLGTIALIALAAILWINTAQVRLIPRDAGRGMGLVRNGYLAAILLTLALAYYKPIQNWREFGNPVYPVALNLGGIKLPGTLDSGGTTPDYLRGEPKMLVWLLSVTEYNAFDARSPFWTNGQGDVQWTSPAFRMGGYFGAYVFLNVFWLLFLQYRLKDRFGWRPLIFMSIMSAITALLPASHELRYYVYWMLSFVAINLILITHGLRGDERFNIRLFFLAAAASCLAFGILSNGGAYLRRTGAEPDRLVEGLGISKKLSGMSLREGETVCVTGRDPLTFLYAPIFNPALSSRTHYAVIDEPTPQECGSHRIVP